MPRMFGKKLSFKAAALLIIGEIFLFILIFAFLVGRGDYYFRLEGPRPHIVVFLVDALRADHLGCYGHEIPTSPFIDRLSEEGTLFETCRSQAPWTKPSVASMFTSVFSSTHQVVSWPGPPGTPIDPNITRRDLLPRQMDTLAELLKERGYRTAAFVTNRWLDPAFGFRQGFDDYYMVTGSIRQGPDGKKAIVPNLPADHLNARLRAYLDQRTPSGWENFLSRFRIYKRPLFIYLHYMDVHGPYLPPARFIERARSLYSGVEDRRLSEQEIEGLGYLDLGSDSLNFYRSRYDGQIIFFDREMERLMGWLQAKGALSPAVMVLTADHGEAFIEHGWFAHGNSLYEEEIHVPLIIWGSAEFPRGSRVSDPVQVIDIAPTLLEIAGADSPDQFEGRSLLGLVRGNALPERAVWSENYTVDAPQITRILNGKKFILDEPGARVIEYYDLDRDPHEQSNLIETLSEKQRSARSRQIVEWRNAQANKLHLESEAPGNLMTEDIRRELEALGYLGGPTKK